MKNQVRQASPHSGVSQKFHRNLFYLHISGHDVYGCGTFLKQYIMFETKM